MSENKLEYIYLIQEREFIKTKENIYKIGKTKQENLKRFHSYPNGSSLLFHMICKDCDILERILMKLFKKMFKHRKDIGNEYFEGDPIQMIIVIFQNNSQLHFNKEFLDFHKEPESCKSQRLANKKNITDKQERINESKRNYYRNNQNSFKNYREENKEKYLEYQREYREKNKN